MTEKAKNNGVTLKVSIEANKEFKGRMAGLVFDRNGGLITQNEVKKGNLELPIPAEKLSHYRLFISPLPEEGGGQKPSIKLMERLNAFEPVLSLRGDLIEHIIIPGNLVDKWVFCLCWIRGHVVKNDGSGPVCHARVHICEVDPVWRWIIRLPDLEVIRLRDDLIKVIERPRIPFPPQPQPDPAPFERIMPNITSGRFSSAFTDSRNLAAINPQPEPPSPANLQLQQVNLSVDMIDRLKSSSVQMVRDTLVANVTLLIPYLCLWPYWWWRFRCDEIAVVETDMLGRFQALIAYLCNGDKPDLYFWVEYEISGSWETVYKPPLPCTTHWNYACGTEVTIRISDDRVPGCGAEPDPGGCVVQILTIGNNISMSEIHGQGASATEVGLTTAGQPFGGHIEPRVWFSRSELRDTKNIWYYRWSYRRYDSSVSRTDDTGWTILTRDVVRHYPKPILGGFNHVPYKLGPQPVGTEPNLFEITPVTNPEGGYEWTVVDQHEDLASAHFMTMALGTGSTFEERAFDAAGKYELKLELFDKTGNRVDDWDTLGINLQISNIPAPFGTGTVTFDSAPSFNRIIRAGKTAGFYMMMHVDNNPCKAELSAVSGPGLIVDLSGCGFIEYSDGASAILRFKPYHPNDFATFNFNVVLGVTHHISRASAVGKVGNTPIATQYNPSGYSAKAYALQADGYYQENFLVSELLSNAGALSPACERGAFSEALHVWTMAVNGYGRIWELDAFNHAGFALSRPCPVE